MKTVILAGGLGTRLSEETESRPKPMVEIGGRPIIWHIMSAYASYGHHEFVVALGYKGEFVKDFFLRLFQNRGGVTVDLGTGAVDVHESAAAHERWKVHLVDTGRETNTGGRIKRLSDWVSDGTFMLTYGDGVANVDVAALLAFHRSHGKLATVTAVRPPARFGGLVFGEDRVCEFTEKPQIGEGWINGGFFVLEPGVLDYLSGDESSFERDSLESIANDGELMACRHEGYWQCMDTLRDVRTLNQLWEAGKAPWKTW